MIRARPIAIVLVVLLATSAVAPWAVAAELDHGDERADLDVRQPSYVEESVERETQDNRTVYHAQGPELELRLEAVDHSDVEASGVLEGSGSIEYNDDVDAWIFDAEGEAGTRVVYFDVVETTEETREVEADDGNGTTTETTTSTESYRIVATLSVKNVEWAHRPADEDDQIREDAANWSSVASDARRVGGGDPVDEVLADAFDYYEFMENPFSTFLDDARGTVMMATRPGGLAVFGGILGLAAVILGYTIVKLHRREKQIEEIGDVDAARDEAYLDMAREVLQQMDWDEIVPEHLARHCRNYLGRNCYLGYKRYLLLRSPTHTKGLLLQLMGQVGYVGRARLDEAGEVVGASVVHSSELDDDVATDGGAEPTTVDLERINSDSETDRRFVDLVPGDDLDVDVLYRPDDLDLEAVEWPIDERHASDSELLQAINPEFPDDFEDEEQLADVLAGLIQLVGNHDFTTDDGRPRGDRDLLSFLSELDSVLADEVDFPLTHIQRRMLILAAERMDTNEELRAHVDRLTDEGLELGGELERGDDDEDDDDPDGAASAITGDDGDDGDDPDDDISVDDSQETDEDAENGDEESAPVDGDSTGDDGRTDDDSDVSPLASADAEAPLVELAEAAGYSVHTGEGLEELALDAGVSWDMDDDEIASRVLVHCRRELSRDELIEILDVGGDS